MFQTLLQLADGSYLEFVAATAGRDSYIQDERDRGLCKSDLLIDEISQIHPSSSQAITN
jgi:hypothetical protein